MSHGVGKVQYGPEPLSHSRRWLGEECSSPYRVLSSARWQSLAPMFQSGAALLVLVLFSMTNLLYGFLSRLLATQYRCPYMVPLAFAQVLVTLLALQLLRASGCITLPQRSLHLTERLLVPSICGAIQSVLALWTELNVPNGLGPMLSSLLPLLCVGWTHVLGLVSAPSRLTTTWLSISTLTSVTITGMKGVLEPQALGLFYAPLTLLLHSVALTWPAKVGEDGGAGTLQICYTLTAVKSLVLGFLSLLHPDGSRLLIDGSWHSGLFLGYLLGQLLLGALQRLLLDVTALRFSPLAAALLASAYDLITPLYSLL